MMIGRRSAVTDIRTLWPAEVRFSDWLASDAGVELIAADLGIQLENVRRECRGSDYSCDIVANMVGDESNVVIIENQYGKTDHDHLGKFLTYTATHKALTCIWIAERIADDHRAAVDWLNDNTPETFSFYAAELKAYRIEDSPAAPQLDVVCKPNLQVKIARGGTSSTETELHQWRRQFWEEIQDALRAQGPRFRLQKPSTDAWSSISLGKSHIHMDMYLVPLKKNIGLGTIITGPDKNEWFERLQAHKEGIESEIGYPLQWIRERGEKSAMVYLEHQIDPKEAENRSSVIAWFKENVPKWHLAFSRRTELLR